MSNNDYNDAFTLYNSLADDLIEKINNTQVKLYYVKSRLEPIINGFSNKPTSLQRLGGRVPVDQMAGRYQEAGENLQEAVYEDIIKARVYWEPKGLGQIFPELKIESYENICKMITYSKHENKLLSADYVEIDGRKCKMVRRPLPHGLGGNKRYITSYWEVFDSNE